jgi:DNA-directed RNA polymerase specialized sigma24 family protein
MRRGRLAISGEDDDRELLARLTRAGLATVDRVGQPIIRRGLSEDQPASAGEILLARALVAFEDDEDMLREETDVTAWARKTVRSVICDSWRRHRETRSRRLGLIASHWLDWKDFVGDEESPREPWDAARLAAADAAVRALRPQARTALVWRRIHRLGPREIAFRLGLDSAGYDALSAEIVRAMSRAARDFWTSFDPDSQERIMDDDHDDSPTEAELEAQEKLLFAYSMRSMSKKEAAAFEHLLEIDEDMHHRMAPFLSFWTADPLPAEQETLDKIWVDEALKRIHRKPLDRRAVLVTPRQPYYDWLAGLAGDAALELEFRAADASRWPRVFLTPSYRDEKSTEEFINERMPQLFEALLEFLDRRDAWPADRSAAAFHRWFKVTHAEDVDDLVSSRQTEAAESESEAE